MEENRKNVTIVATQHNNIASFSIAFGQFPVQVQLVCIYCGIIKKSSGLNARFLFAFLMNQTQMNLGYKVRDHSITFN